MFVYEKKLQYPVRIKNTNPALAKFIISQYGGPDSNKLYTGQQSIENTGFFGYTPDCADGRIILKQQKRPGAFRSGRLIIRLITRPPVAPSRCW